MFYILKHSLLLINLCPVIYVIYFYKLAVNLMVFFLILSPLHVCCIGAGPGSEVLGLHKLLPKDTHWYLMDNCEQWSHTAQLLLKNVPDIKFNYALFDVMSRLQHSDNPKSPAHVFKKVVTLFNLLHFHV